jgi:hypothetical protein
MTVKDAAGALRGRVVVGEADAAREVHGGYVSDLLSDVIANAHEGDLWITLQRHSNIVAVAVLKGLAAIVLVSGREPEPETAKRAAEEHVVLVSTQLDAFNAVGVLYAQGVRGRRSPEGVHA